MDIEVKIRAVLKEYRLTVRELADFINVDRAVVDNFTAYKMLDVYEEDNGKLLLLGYEGAEKYVRTRNKWTSEVIDFAKKHSATRGSVLCTIINQRFGATFSTATLYEMARRNGFKIGLGKTKWTNEMDDFVRNTNKLSCREVAKEIGARFGVSISNVSVASRRKKLGCTLYRVKWTNEIDRFIVNTNAPNREVLREAINKRFGTDFTLQAVSCRMSGLGVRLERR